MAPSENPHPAEIEKEPSPSSPFEDKTNSLESRLEALKERQLAAIENSEHIMQFFAWDHLPTHLSATASAFAALAQRVVQTTPGTPSGQQH